MITKKKGQKNLYNAMIIKSQSASPVKIPLNNMGVIFTETSKPTPII